MIGTKIHNLAKRLWGINRSITGEGVRETLSIIKNEHLPNLSIKEVPSGTKVLDWIVPREWKIRDAYIRTPSGEIICDFKRNNLHVVGYSIPIHKHMNLSELNSHLYSLDDQPDAIPYITSYYSEHWGFCITQKQRDQLTDGLYEVFIDSELFSGSLTYGELILPGISNKEVFLSTYICYPSMANNELSGPTVTTYIAKWLDSLPYRKYTYRIVFIPETIGSITYISQNINWLKSHVIGGFNITCIGDDRTYSYLPSRNGSTLSDIIAKHVLKHIYPDFKSYSWSDRGSDERQYCAPGIDLPIASIMRTKYGEYLEYHTSLDDLINVVTPTGLEGGYNALKLAIEALEWNCYPKVTVLGEPQLGKRGLYPTLSTKTSGQEVQLMMDFISWSDGVSSLIEIADKCKVPIWNLYPIILKLMEHDLLVLLPQKCQESRMETSQEA
ncbi:DUF4910 domain-containing protein [Legionella pneumophila]|uniref:DUF4910 domain-containing protein n=1 Tax=Legionella pneumophila TaxID=446 RepID=A0AAP3MCL7_LEGPN|nr:DUF4910 domain-containing protein [Legionella pneumophila]MCZ4692650.1 DUF4910 domain-containing protein [Legionella pneumophila]MCZ4711114.1 DUF4910 domain-containing protein [Legionella pneumophila]MCZ4719431.1 DUF4910 domain-containing protein [Legionella pneumophila]